MDVSLLHLAYLFIVYGCYCYVYTLCTHPVVFFKIQIYIFVQKCILRYLNSILRNIKRFIFIYFFSYVGYVSYPKFFLMLIT